MKGKTLKAMQACTGKKATQTAYSACHVHGGAAWATDSYVIVRYEDDATKACAGAYYIDPAMVKAVGAGEAVMFGDGFAESANGVSLKPVDGMLNECKYPQLEKIFDVFSPDAAVKGSMFDPALCARVLKVFESAGLRPTMQFDRRMARMFASNDECRVEAIVMGIRTEGGDDYVWAGSNADVRNERDALKREVEGYKRSIAEHYAEREELKAEVERLRHALECHDDAYPAPCTNLEAYVEAGDAPAGDEPVQDAPAAVPGDANPAVPTVGEWQGPRVPKREPVSYETAAKALEAMGLGCKVTKACLWVVGKATKADRDALMSMGFVWSRKRSQWYLKRAE